MLRQRVLQLLSSRSSETVCTLDMALRHSASNRAIIIVCHSNTTSPPVYIYIFHASLTGFLFTPALIFAERSAPCEVERSLSLSFGDHRPLHQTSFFGTVCVKEMVPVLAGADVHPSATPLRVYRFTLAGGRASDVEDRVSSRSGTFRSSRYPIC